MSKLDVVQKEASTPTPLVLFTQKLLILSAFVATGYFLSLLAPFLSILFFSGFLTILFSPFLDKMRRYRIPDWLGILVIFSVFLLFLLIALLAIAPIFIKQIALLLSTLSGYLSGLEGAYTHGGFASLGLPGWLAEYLWGLDVGMIIEFLRGHASSLAKVVADSAGQIASSGVSIVASLSGGIFQGVMILVFTFFITLERASVRKAFYEALPVQVTKYLISRENTLTRTLTAWIRGQVLLGLAIFALTLVWLLSLKVFGIHIEGIFTLALIAGLMEFIPYIGPFLALLPALAIAAGMGFSPVIAVLILYIIIQQAENNIIVPMVMSRALDISPFLILATMTALGSLFGIVGILLAIPAATLLKMGFSDFIAWKKR